MPLWMQNAFKLNHAVECDDVNAYVFTKLIGIAIKILKIPINAIKTTPITQRSNDSHMP